MKTFIGVLFVAALVVTLVDSFWSEKFNSSEAYTAAKNKYFAAIEEKFTFSETHIDAKNKYSKAMEESQAQTKELETIKIFIALSKTLFDLADDDVNKSKARQKYLYMLKKGQVSAEEAEEADNVVARAKEKYENALESFRENKKKEGNIRYED